MDLRDTVTTVLGSLIVTALAWTANNVVQNSKDIVALSNSKLSVTTYTEREDILLLQMRTSNETLIALVEQMRNLDSTLSRLQVQVQQTNYNGGGYAD